MKAIYVAPLLAIFGGGIALAFVLKRWRKNSDAAGDMKSDDDAPKRDNLDDRIDQELEDLDDE